MLGQRVGTRRILGSVGAERVGARARDEQVQATAIGQVDVDQGHVEAQAPMLLALGGGLGVERRCTCGQANRLDQVAASALLDSTAQRRNIRPRREVPGVRGGAGQGSR